MNKKLIIALMAIGVIALAWFIFPKDAGGPMCGPVCVPMGLHTYERDCIGIEVRDSSMLDSYVDRCYGLVVGEKRCYGRPYDAYETLESDILMDCGYPCGDEYVMNECSQKPELSFGPLTLSCEALLRRCAED